MLAEAGQTARPNGLNFFEETYRLKIIDFFSLKNQIFLKNFRNVTLAHYY